MRRAQGRCSAALGPADDDLQPLEPVEPARRLERDPLGHDGGGLDRRNRIVDSSYIKAHRSAGGGKVTRARAIGVSRGGRTTTIHALVDILGRPLRRVLKPGNVSDARAAVQLIDEAAGMKRPIAGKGHDANRLRARMRAQGAIPVIPGRRNRERPIQYDKRRYENRWRIEAMSRRLKDFRRVATRCEKLARNFLSAVRLAAANAFWT